MKDTLILIKCDVNDAAKCEYALKGQIKHSDDLMELMTNKTKPKNTDDFIF